MKALNLYGQRFGYLEVIGQTDYLKDNSGHIRRKWICKCDCGNVVSVLGSSLNTGKTKSCGCERYGKNNITHNKSKTRLYRIWTNLKTRCNNPKFPGFQNYGGGGE